MTLNMEMKENGVKKRILMVDDEVGFTLSFGLALEDNEFLWLTHIITL